MIDRIREREISMLAMSAVAAGLQAIRAAYLFAFKRNVIQGLRSTSNQETYSDLKLPDSRCRPSKNSGTISKANIKYLPPRGQLRRGHGDFVQASKLNRLNKFCPYLVGYILVICD
jgi:hypothetical protein